MPSIGDAAKKIQNIVDRPQNRLGDASIGSLVELFSAGSPAWLTGSTVWLPAVFGDDPVRDGDFDIVFYNKEATAKFVAGVLGDLNRRAPVGHRFDSTTNALGGTRITHPDGKGVIDAWHLGDNESIAELIEAYPGARHYKCAYQISKNPTAGNLLRLVKRSEEKESDQNWLSDLDSRLKAKFERSSYRASYPYDL